MDDTERRATLDRIEQRIAKSRVRYLQSAWADRQSDADRYERRVDHLLGQWDEIRAGHRVRA